MAKIKWQATIHPLLKHTQSSFSQGVVSHQPSYPYIYSSTPSSSTLCSPARFLQMHQLSTADKDTGNMGNCLRRDSSTVWASDDDWETAAPKHHIAEKEGLLADHHHAALISSLSSSSSNREIKIKITKKQLEELLGRMEKHEVPADQVLSRLINASESCELPRQRSWRPRLQSIPEVN